MSLWGVRQDQSEERKRSPSNVTEAGALRKGGLWESLSCFVLFLCLWESLDGEAKGPQTFMCNVSCFDL